MALKRRRLTKKAALESRRIAKLPKQNLNCKDCGRPMMEVSPDVVKVTCANCVQKLVPFESKETVTDSRPRGWHRKKLFICESGKTYSYGKEISNEERPRISKSLPTGVKSTTKASKTTKGGKGRKRTTASGTARK